MRYFTFFGTESLKFGVYVTLTAQLALKATFSVVKVKDSPAKTTKLCLIENYFTLLLS